MTDNTTPATGAQPGADAIDTIISDVVNAPAPDAKTDNTAEPKPEDTAPEDDTPFPKKAVNAISRRDKTIGKTRAQLEAANAELARLREQLTPRTEPKKDGAPNEADYKTYAEFLEARSEYLIDQKLTARDSKQKETQTTEAEKQWLAHAENNLALKAQEFAKENPDVADLVDEHADIVDAYPMHIKRLFLEADNAPLAFYNLAKEGKLEALASMSPAKAAMEIGRAQTQAPAKPKSNAPTPLPASRGSVAAQKSPDKWSAEEAQNWLNT